MKKIIYTFIISLTFVACKKNSVKNNSNMNVTLSGKWYVMSIVYNYYDGNNKLLYTQNYNYNDNAKYYYTWDFGSQTVLLEETSRNGLRKESIPYSYKDNNLFLDAAEESKFFDKSLNLNLLRLTVSELILLRSEKVEYYTDNTGKDHQATKGEITYNLKR